MRKKTKKKTVKIGESCEKNEDCINRNCIQGSCVRKNTKKFRRKTLIKSRRKTLIKSRRVRRK